LRIEPGESLPGGGEGVVEFAAAALSFPWTVRRVEPGDRLRLAGMSGRKRLKELLMERKVTLEERRSLYVLTKEEILWVGGIRRSGLYLPRFGYGVWRVVYVPSNSSLTP
jgi:tRNA(Ile)-lysidine synthase